MFMSVMYVWPVGMSMFRLFMLMEMFMIWNLLIVKMGMMQIIMSVKMYVLCFMMVVVMFMLFKYEKNY